MGDVRRLELERLSGERAVLVVLGGGHHGASHLGAGSTGLLEAEVALVAHPAGGAGGDPVALRADRAPVVDAAEISRRHLGRTERHDRTIEGHRTSEDGHGTSLVDRVLTDEDLADGVLVYDRRVALVVHRLVAGDVGALVVLRRDHDRDLQFRAGFRLGLRVRVGLGVGRSLRLVLGTDDGLVDGAACRLDTEALAHLEGRLVRSACAPSTLGHHLLSGGERLPVVGVREEEVDGSRGVGRGGGRGPYCAPLAHPQVEDERRGLGGSLGRGDGEVVARRSTCATTLLQVGGPLAVDHSRLGELAHLHRCGLVVPADARVVVPARAPVAAAAVGLRLAHDLGGHVVVGGS